MLTQAVSTTAALFLAAVLSKILLDSHDAGGHASELMRQALHWRDVSVQDSDPVLRLQHAATAAALLSAARGLCGDADLERASGMDVPRLARSLETAVVNARQFLKPPSASVTVEEGGE